MFIKNRDQASHYSFINTEGQDGCNLVTSGDQNSILLDNHSSAEQSILLTTTSS